MRNSKRALLVWLPSLFLTSVLFQNCGGFKVIGSGGEGGSTSLNQLEPPSDKLDANCQSSSDYDVCIFKKSTVSQNGASVGSDGLSADSLTGLQKYGVKLTGLDGSGLLKNAALSVETMTGTPYQVGSGKVGIDSTGADTSVEQLMAYYWMNRAVEYLSRLSEDFALADKGIKVIVDDKVAGWNDASNTIHLKKKSGQAPMAFDGGAMIYFLAEANLHHATEGEIWNLGSSRNHNTCGGVKNGCCATEDGCAKAIASGAADYLVGVMFPYDPKLGEAWLNSEQGAGYCGQKRDLNANSDLTAANAFGACGAKQSDGEIHTMGSVYASIWWEVRKASGNEVEVDQLYFKHLQKLNGTDTFSSALTKIKAADQELFGGKYGEKFSAQFSSRGL